MRLLGVQGENLPTKKSKTVKASDFLIGGIIGQFERKYDKAFLVQSEQEMLEIFGKNISTSFYGFDVVSSMFKNLAGVDGKVYIKAHVGNTGSAIDAVQASAAIADAYPSTPETTFTIKAGYLNNDEYGVHGNRIGYKLTNGYRFTTACNGVPNTSNTYVDVDSVAGVKVGDVVGFKHAPSTWVYKKITAIDQTLKRLSFATAFGSSEFSDDDPVYVLGIRVQIYEKSLSGIVTEVETDIGRIYCSLESDVTDYYIDNVFANHKYAKIVSAVHTHTLNDKFPADVTTITYLASGADGTAPTTDAHWSFHNLVAFDNLPIRFLANAETTLAAHNLSGEIYCKARWDNPKWLYNIPANQTKAQLLIIGNSYQRGDDVSGVLIAHWLKITDPFATSSNAPYREIPNVGFTMGLWMRGIATYGIHYIPALKQLPLLGVMGIVGTQFTSATDRTDLAEAGVNCIEYITGFGYCVRNFFTPSTATESMFANGILMRDYFKISGVDSLQTSENMPNSFNRIQEDKWAMYSFLRQLWDVGSTGSVPLGETFGQSQNDDGTPTTFDDHVEVIADLVNNPQTRINLGERNIDVYFTYPAPAGSFRIRVGLMLRS